MNAAQRIKIQAAIDAAWLDMTDEDRYRLRVAGAMTGRNYVVFRHEGDKIVMAYGGQDFGCITKAELFPAGDGPDGNYQPQDAPDAD